MLLSLLVPAEPTSLAAFLKSSGLFQPVVCASATVLTPEFVSCPQAQERILSAWPIHAEEERDAEMQTPDLESLVSRDYDRCHPDDSFADLKLRARFTKEDRGLLTDWLNLASLRQQEAASRSEGR